jgi:hypothetical protein
MSIRILPQVYLILKCIIKMLTYDMIIIPIRNHESHKTLKRQACVVREKKIITTDS